MNKHLEILERYIPDLERIAAEINKRNGEHVTVEQLLEETVSEMTYDWRKMYDLSGALPVEYINGKRYYRDDRMREYRNTEDFSDSIKFDD